MPVESGQAPAGALTSSRDGQPGALRLEASEEAPDHAVLLRRVWRDELLTKLVVPTGCAEAPALEDQAVVASNDRRFPLGPSLEPSGQRVRPQATSHAMRPDRVLK
jgi:hypothetical protein